MPMGTGTPTLQTIPVQAFERNPGLFFTETVRTQERIEQHTVTAGATWNTPLPQVGVIQKLRTIIKGTITIASGGATPGANWPHGILEDAKFSANGQNDLHGQVSGIDLHTMRFCRFPAYEEAVDTFPGTVGGGPAGGSLAAIAAGTYDVHLTFEHPVAADESTLVGGVFAQSSAANLNLRRKIAAISDLFTANASNVSWDLTAYTHEVRFEIPIGADGRLIVPDLSRLMAINGTDVQFSGTGAVEVPMVRSAGQLHRLFTRVRSTSTQRLSPSPTVAANKRLDAFRLVYGGNKRPLDFDPITDLLAQSNNWYGSIPPYDTVVLDLVRENPGRDLLLLQGVTELKAVPTVNAAVTVSGGVVHLVQQTLFAGG